MVRGHPQQAFDGILFEVGRAYTQLAEKAPDCPLGISLVLCRLSLSALAVGYVVEQGFIGYLFHFTGAVHFLSLGADMLYLNAPARPDDFIGFGFKFHHGRKICGDGIGGPHIDVDDTVEGPALLLDGAKAGQGVIAVGQG